MELTLKIKMDNAAFDNEPLMEAARIIRHAGTHLQCGAILPFNLYDYNGNIVGNIEVTA